MAHVGHVTAWTFAFEGSGKQTHTAWLPQGRATNKQSTHEGEEYKKPSLMRGRISSFFVFWGQIPKTKNDFILSRFWSKHEVPSLCGLWRSVAKPDGATMHVAL